MPLDNYRTYVLFVLYCYCVIEKKADAIFRLLDAL